MKCKHCGEEVGEFYSQLSEHLWAKHHDFMMRFLASQSLSETVIKEVEE